MIDVGKLTAAIGEGPADTVVPADFTRAYLRQVVADIVAGREAMEQLELLREHVGRCFGLKPEERL